jgi:Ran GTPase-activating protein (RanGAP) involved in mRNA processing and transport
MLLEGLRDNQSITKLNIGSNSLGGESMTALSVVLREPASELLILDMSSNQLSDDDVDVLYSTIQRKSKLISLDLRMNSTSQENETLGRIADLLHTNELAYREGN